MSSERETPSETLIRAATKYAANLRKRWGAFDAETAARASRAFRAALYPRRLAGRKPDWQTVRAAEIWTAGIAAFRGPHTRTAIRQHQKRLWQRIYGEVYPDLDAADRLTWQYRTATLRRNVKAWLRRRGAIALDHSHRHMKTTD
jgi:hypothetical protein